jgi:nucleoside-diphosphate-sugar epimerase
VTLRVAVTGAGGFLGAAAVRRLLDAGHEVLALVRPGGRRERLGSLEGHPRLAVAALDLHAPAAAGSPLAAFRPGAVLHAGWSGVGRAERQDPAQHRNVAATVALLEAAAAAGARRFVGLGSQAEYGPRRAAIREDGPTRPTTVYGAAKLAAGHLVTAIAPPLGVSAAWVRVFSVYGPGEAPGALLPDVVAALRAGRELPLSSGEQRWDYLHVDDAADALARLLAAPDATGFFNLGSGRTVRLREVVERLAALVAPGSSGRLLFGARPDGELTHLEADVERLRAATGWAPRVDLDAGLASLARA